MAIPWFLRKHILFSALPALWNARKENIFFLCELCALSEAGGEKILPLTRIAKPGPSA
jgi:hypothetical protein